jgi:hypothetical protein
MLPELALRDRDASVTLRAIAEGPVQRVIFAAIRATDATRPSTRALLAAGRRAAGVLARGGAGSLPPPRTGGTQVRSRSEGLGLGAGPVSAPARAR